MTDLILHNFISHDYLFPRNKQRSRFGLNSIKLNNSFTSLQSVLFLLLCVQLTEQQLKVFLYWLFIDKFCFKRIDIFVNFNDKTNIDIDASSILLADSSIRIKTIFACKAFTKA